MAGRITLASLAEQLTADRATNAAQFEQVANVLGSIADRLDQGQHNTTAPVAEKAKKAKATPVVVNPRDAVKSLVESKGLAFAKGGALQGSVAVAEAIVRVLKANKVGGGEVVSVQGDVKSLDGRKVTHIAVGLSAPGVFFTQYVYTPER